MKWGIFKIPKLSASEMTMEKQKIIEAFAELPLSKEFVESESPVSPSSVENLSEKPPVKPTIICPEPCADSSDQPEEESLSRAPSVDINYNHLTDQSPSDPGINLNRSCDLLVFRQK